MKIRRGGGGDSMRFIEAQPISCQPTLYRRALGTFHIRRCLPRPVPCQCGTQEDVWWSWRVRVATTGWHVGEEFDAGVVLMAVNLAGHVGQWAERVDVPNQ